MDQFEFTPKQLEKMNACTHLQAMFVINYVRCGMTKLDAYRAAGGRATTEESARAGATGLFAKRHVKEFYDSLMESAAGESVMGREEALVRLTRIARAEVFDVIDVEQEPPFDEDGNPQPACTRFDLKRRSEMGPEARAAIKSITPTKWGLKIELHDSMGAMKQIAELLGWEAPKKLDIDANMQARVKAEQIVSEMDPTEAAKLYVEFLQQTGGADDE